MLDKGDLVRITWDDAEDPDESKSWLSEADLEAFSTQETLVVSVGWVVSHTPKYLTLCADYIARLKHSGRATKITTAQILKIERLTLGEALAE